MLSAIAEGVETGHSFRCSGDGADNKDLRRPSPTSCLGRVDAGKEGRLVN